MKDHAWTEARNQEPPPGLEPQRGLRSLAYCKWGSHLYAVGQTQP
jgi:hypothetical protein